MELMGAGAIERVRSGDAEAFRLLVEEHTRSVYRLAFRLTRNETDADDVVQETFLRAYRYLNQFDNRSSFATWLHRIATNAAFDLLRKRQRLEVEEQEAETIDERPDRASSPQDDMVMKLGVTTALDRGLKLLTGKERMAFVLRHFEGMSIDEIGRVMGLEESAAKNTIFRAVKKLRPILAPLVGVTT